MIKLGARFLKLRLTTLKIKEAVIASFLCGKISFLTHYLTISYNGGILLYDISILEKRWMI